jgi:hypothetical protein
LHRLRETHGMRAPSQSQSEEPGALQELSTQVLVVRLDMAGYHISVQEYSAIEAGESFPDPEDLPTFVAAIASSLELTPPQRELLHYVLAYDVLRAEADERFAVLALISRLLSDKMP